MSAYGALADRLMLGYGQAEPGIRYARKTQHTNKHMARNDLLSLFSPRVWPGPLSILTMPGLDWSFEKSLLSMRDSGRIAKGKIPRRTYITSVERNPAIFHAALRRIPDGERSLDCRIAVPSFARSVVRTYQVGRYYNCDLIDLVPGMTANWPKWNFYAAWIDLTGPITPSILATLQALWERDMRCLVVTSLKARWPQPLSDEVAAAGGVTNVLLDRLPGSIPLREYEYRDGSPMHQVVLLKAIA